MKLTTYDLRLTTYDFRRPSGDGCTKQTILYLYFLFFFAPGRDRARGPGGEMNLEIEMEHRAPPQKRGSGRAGQARPGQAPSKRYKYLTTFRANISEKANE